MQILGPKLKGIRKKISHSFIDLISNTTKDNQANLGKLFILTVRKGKDWGIEYKTEFCFVFLRAQNPFEDDSQGNEKVTL